MTYGVRPSKDDERRVPRCFIILLAVFLGGYAWSSSTWIGLILTAHHDPIPPSTAISINKPANGVLNGLECNIWSSDLHPSPSHDVRTILASGGKTANCTFIERSFAAKCGYSGFCFQPEDSDIISDLRGAVGDEQADEGAVCKNQGFRKFWNRYRNDTRIKDIDVFLCQHLFGICQVFMSLGKPMILIASTRYDIAQTSTQWMRLNKHLQALATRPNVVIGANNLFDVKFIQHFTGLGDDSVRLIPSATPYAVADWSATRSAILVGPIRFNPRRYLRRLRKTAKARKMDFKFEYLKTLYPYFTWADLAAHRAIVLIPYQVSIMSIFEYYAIGIPMFAPSLTLLKSWHMNHHLMKELTWHSWRRRDLFLKSWWYGRPYFTRNQSSPIAPAPGHANDPDPLAVYSDASLDHWLKFSDFYQWPHIQIFDTFDDLVQQLKTLDETDGFRAIHNAMKKEFGRRLAASQEQWGEILQAVLSSRNRDTERRAREAASWEQAMDMLYPELSEETHKEC